MFIAVQLWMAQTKSNQISIRIWIFIFCRAPQPKEMLIQCYNIIYYQMKNITEAELNKAIATPPNSSLPQLDTSWVRFGSLYLGAFCNWNYCKIKPFKTTNLRPLSKYFTHFLFRIYAPMIQYIFQKWPHLFIVCAEIASAAAVYTLLCTCG